MACLNRPPGEEACSKIVTSYPFREVRMRTEMRDVDSGLLSSVQNFRFLWDSNFNLVND
jgi:hypothetical protein